MVLCMLMTLSVCAQQRQRMSAEERAKTETEMMKKELNLTAAQAHKVDSIALHYAQKLDGVMATGEREKMREAFQANTEEKDKAFKAILTDDQYKKYKELEQVQMGQRRTRN